MNARLYEKGKDEPNGWGNGTKGSVIPEHHEYVCCVVNFQRRDKPKLFVRCTHEKKPKEIYA